MSGSDGLVSTVGRGLAAGLAGTAVMTISSTIEQKLRGRPPSTAPADAAAKVLGIHSFPSDGAKNAFSNLVHWSYGTGWGAGRALFRDRCVQPEAAGCVGTGVTPPRPSCLAEADRHLALHGWPQASAYRVDSAGD